MGDPGPKNGRNVGGDLDAVLRALLQEVLDAKLADMIRVVVTDVVRCELTGRISADAHTSSEDQRLFSVEEISERCTVATGTVRRWIKSGLLPATRLGRSREYRVVPADLENFLARGPHDETPDSDANVTRLFKSIRKGN